MRTATLIVAAVSSLALTAPSLAQQGAGGAMSRPSPLVRMMSAPRAPAPLARPMPPQRPGGWQPRPGMAPRPGGWRPGKPGGWKPGAHRPGWRWGDKINGRWHAGWKAPGGWRGYRRPVRGWTLPSYWIGGGFWISDWSSWGLSSPPYGYNWVRYYDDAVLVDRNGRVWDSVSGVDWDRDDTGDDDYGYDERDGGGAYADGRDGHGADYDAPDHGEPDYDADDRGPPPPPPPPVGAPGRVVRCVANCHVTVGYGYGAPVTTTVVIQSSPVVTTTTTVTEDVVTYGGGRKVVRRAPSKLLYRAPARVKAKTCNCR